MSLGCNRTDQSPDQPPRQPRSAGRTSATISLVGPLGLLAVGVDRRAHDDEAIDAQGDQAAEPLDAVLGGPTTAKRSMKSSLSLPAWAEPLRVCMVMS